MLPLWDVRRPFASRGLTLCLCLQARGPAICRAPPNGAERHWRVLGRRGGRQSRWGRGQSCRITSLPPAPEGQTDRPNDQRMTPPPLSSPRSTPHLLGTAVTVTPAPVTRPGDLRPVPPPALPVRASGFSAAALPSPALASPPSLPPRESDTKESGPWAPGWGQSGLQGLWPPLAKSARW